jgi:oligopeptidase B
MLKKKNTFLDFIACAEYLTKARYASKDKVFAMGGSAGGLLMGAISNMRPELVERNCIQRTFCGCCDNDAR